MRFYLLNQFDKHKLFFLGLCFAIFMASCEKEEELAPFIEPEKEEEDIINSGTGIGEMRDISSFDLVAEMGVGWNLGNSFDVPSTDKTEWGNPLPAKSVIEEVRSLGFKTIRIPVTWGPHFNQDAAPYKVDRNYLGKVKQVVDWSFESGMHVIINVHHDNGWILPTAASAELSKAKLGAVWTQIADYFKPYNDSLIFETLNEPRLGGIPEEWTGGTAEGRAFINDFHKTAVDAIRGTGGNNTKRHLMITTWAAGTEHVAMDDLVIPNNDPNIIISLHSYFPWAFAGEGSASWGTDSDKEQLANELEKIRQKWIVEEKRPVILGEWGSTEKSSLTDRVNYARFYAGEAAKRGLLTVVWDDGGMFRMYNRRDAKWDYIDIARTIVGVSK